MLRAVKFIRDTHLKSQPVLSSSPHPRPSKEATLPPPAHRTELSPPAKAGECFPDTVQDKTNRPLSDRCERQ